MSVVRSVQTHKKFRVLGKVQVVLTSPHLLGHLHS